jgi:hypothetical protein
VVEICNNIPITIAVIGSCQLNNDLKLRKTKLPMGLMKAKSKR